MFCNFFLDRMLCYMAHSEELSDVFFLFFLWCTVATAKVKAVKLYNILNERLKVKL